MEFPPLIDLGEDDADSSPLHTSSSQDLFHPNYGVPQFTINETRARSSPFFDSSSSSEDGDAFVAESDSVDYTAKRLDYMLEFLDRRLSSNSNLNSSSDCLTDENSQNSSHRNRSRSCLPEFVGRGGGSGIFRLPDRTAVHPHRPPSLDVRPHPLRETQIGCFLRSIGGGSSKLWAGTECGLRAWNFQDLYFAAEVASVRVGDEGTAPFVESVMTSPTFCLTVDEASRVVWSGHKDGRIMCWTTTNLPNSSTNAQFSESLSWYAHRGPVLSLVMTSYGDLWSGSEGGEIKVWPWEELEKAVNVTAEEGYMASMSVEKSYIDLRSQVTVNGFSNTLTWDVKYLLSDDSTAKVWSGCYFSLALWDARTKELLKVFNSDGQMENRVDISTGQDIAMDSVSFSKKEKTQSSFGFFQRSRNAIIGAADAVRRVAAKGAFGEDNRRTEALVMAVDGMIWTGCTSGQLVQWDGNGNRLQDFLYHPYAVQCLCTFGQRLWVGYSSGIVQVLDLIGQLVGEWVAHCSPIINMTTGGGYVFTLANHGGVRGWNVISPGYHDIILRSELAGKEFLYTKIENLRILTGTWNVGQGRASHDSLISWLGAAASKAAIVVVGLQEVEMGAGFLAMSAARETVGLEGTSLGQWWVEMIDETLGEVSPFQLVGSRQLAGLLIAAWVRDSVRVHVGDVDAAAVPCGFGRAIGNKGAVGLRIRVYDRIMCFVNCHFAAHIEAVNRRNADFEHVYRTMSFCRPTNLFTAAAASSSCAVPILRSSSAVSGSSVERIPELSEADLVIFLGDFNYRLDGISYDEARDFVSQRSFDWLKERDQLRAEMVAGNVFQGMREALITFPPTYKFERHQSGLAGYDSGEKKRIPAWCDRILYRDNQSASVSECSLECPVVSSIIQYEASMDVTDSDHKPVRCIFSVDIARVDESIRRQVYGEILSSNESIKHVLSIQKNIPETIVSTNNIILQNQDSSILRITNKSQESDALFQIICEGESTVNEKGQASDLLSRGSFGFPPWLEVTPATGIIKADQIMEVVVHHEEFYTLEEFVDGVQQNSWCEITLDREVVLIVKVYGNFSTESHNHRVRIRSCCSAKKTEISDELKDSWKSHSNVLQRSDFQRLSSSRDVVDRIKSLHSP